MAQPENLYVENQVLALASVIEGALWAVGEMRDVNMPDLAAMHLAAARDMVQQADFADLVDLAHVESDPVVEKPGSTRRRSIAYGLTVLAIEQTVDARNPDVEPPLSQRLRAQARERYGDRVDEQLAQIPAFPFGK
jgi:hypothetical protein